MGTSFTHIEKLEGVVQIQGVDPGLAVTGQHDQVQALVHIGHFETHHAFRSDPLEGIVFQAHLFRFGQFDQKIRLGHLGPPIKVLLGDLTGHIGASLLHLHIHRHASLLDDLLQLGFLDGRPGGGLVGEHQLVLELFLLDVLLDLGAVAEVTHQHLIDFDPLGLEFLVEQIPGLLRLFHAQGAVVEILGGQLAQGLLEGRFGLGDDAVVLEQGPRTDLGEDQVRVDDVVDDRDIHIHEKTVRGLDMRHAVLAGQVGGGLGVVGQLEHLHIAGKAVHLLHAGDHQVEAGGVIVFLHTAMDAQAYHLDTELVGLYVDEEQVVGKYHHCRDNHQVAELAAAGDLESGNREAPLAKAEPVRVLRVWVGHGCPPYGLNKQQNGFGAEIGSGPKDVQMGCSSWHAVDVPKDPVTQSRPPKISGASSMERGTPISRASRGT
ncbi:hypothetical protein DESC_850018 [Desulfosarcina cetonica]|nr:hypothetical protein DESC_850018 [Desulfosarcina cetonica]